MARHLRIQASASVLVQELRNEGFDFRVVGDRLRVRPAARVTAELRDALRRHKRALLAALQPVTELVFLRGGLTVPRPAFDLALDLESRGVRQFVDAAGEYCVDSESVLTEADRAGIARWRCHLAAIVTYEAPVRG